jgi:ABC-type branched-subunit amino acid transport system permease subunit
MNSDLAASQVGMIVVTLCGVAAMFGLPQLLDLFNLMQLTVFVVMAILTLSLALIWGYAGILCFGQAAFFGLGGYAYAIAALNFDDSVVPVLLSIAVPVGFAIVLGYFMFYGRISNVYLGVITLTVSLILFALVNSTSGDRYRIGRAPIGGYNGIPSIPALHLQGALADGLGPEGMWYLTMGILVLCYVGLRLLLASHFGRVLVAIRENEVRAALVGYDTRRYKLVAFAIAGGMGGIAGCLFANWGAFISPTVFGLAQSAQIIICVIIGGLGTLIGPILGTLAIQYLTTMLGTQQTVDPNWVLGAILIIFVLGIPRGAVPSLLSFLQTRFGRVNETAATLKGQDSEPAGAAH